MNDLENKEKNKNSIFAITVLTEFLCVIMLLSAVFTAKQFKKPYKAIKSFIVKNILEDTNARELLDKVEDAI